MLRRSLIGRSSASGASLPLPSPSASSSPPTPPRWLLTHLPSSREVGCRNRHQGAQGASRNYRGPQPRAWPGPALLMQGCPPLTHPARLNKLLEHTEKYVCKNQEVSALVETQAGKGLDGALLACHSTTAARGQACFPLMGTSGPPGQHHESWPWVPGSAVRGEARRAAFALLLPHAVCPVQQRSVPGMATPASHHLPLAWHLNGMWSDLVSYPSWPVLRALRVQPMASGLGMA